MSSKSPPREQTSIRIPAEVKAYAQEVYGSLGDCMTLLVQTQPGYMAWLKKRKGKGKK